MHVLGLTADLVTVLSDRAAGAKVTRVVLEVGKLAAVVPAVLASCFRACAEGTSLEGAVVDIEEVSGRARCRVCANDVQLEKPFGRCACGSTDLEWLSGDDLRVRTMEIA